MNEMQDRKIYNYNYN